MRAPLGLQLRRRLGARERALLGEVRHRVEGEEARAAEGVVGREDALRESEPEEEKFSFDKWTMSLTSTTRRFELLQPVEVEFIDAPADGDYLALFALVEGCGLKPPKEPKPEGDATALKSEPETESKTDATAETKTNSAASDT